MTDGPATDGPRHRRTSPPTFGRRGAVNPVDVAGELARLRSTIEAVERPWTHHVEIVAVTKGFGPDVIERAVAGGATAIGENYAQELLGKRAVIERLGPIVHFIGHVQSNKVRQIVDLVDVWSRRRPRRRSSTRSPDDRRSADVLIQVNSTGETGKSGCPPEQVVELVDHARRAGLTSPG